MNKIAPQIVKQVEDLLENAARYHGKILSATNRTAYQYKVIDYATRALQLIQSWEDFHGLAMELEETLKKHSYVIQPGNIRHARNKHEEVGQELRLAVQKWKALTAVQPDFASNLLSQQVVLKTATWDELEAELGKGGPKSS